MKVHRFRRIAYDHIMKSIVNPSVGEVNSRYSSNSNLSDGDVTA